MCIRDRYTCIPTPKTIYQGISKLPPGHRLVSRPTVRTHSYWDMAYDEEDITLQRQSAWASQTRDAVRSAVALSLKNSGGSKTTGCFLSGGTDSSSIAG